MGKREGEEEEEEEGKGEGNDDNDECEEDEEDEEARGVIALGVQTRWRPSGSVDIRERRRTIASR